MEGVWGAYAYQNTWVAQVTWRFWTLFPFSFFLSLEDHFQLNPLKTPWVLCVKVCDLPCFKALMPWRFASGEGECVFHLPRWYPSNHSVQRHSKTRKLWVNRKLQSTAWCCQTRWILVKQLQFRAAAKKLLSVHLQLGCTYPHTKTAD